MKRDRGKTTMARRATFSAMEDRWGFGEQGHVERRWYRLETLVQWT